MFVITQLWTTGPTVCVCAEPFCPITPSLECETIRVYMLRLCCVRWPLALTLALYRATAQFLLHRSHSLPVQNSRLTVNNAHYVTSGVPVPWKRTTSGAASLSEALCHSVWRSSHAWRELRCSKTLVFMQGLCTHIDRFSSILFFSEQLYLFCMKASD